MAAAVQGRVALQQAFRRIDIVGQRRVGRAVERSGRRRCGRGSRPLGKHGQQQAMDGWRVRQAGMAGEPFSKLLRRRAAGVASRCLQVAVREDVAQQQGIGDLRRVRKRGWDVRMGLVRENAADALDLAGRKRLRQHHPGRPLRRDAGDGQRRVLGGVLHRSR